MSLWIGWLLAITALVVGYLTQGWQGVVLAFTVITFWLLLQFGRAMRVMRAAATSPVGHVSSAVMFNARLVAGMRVLDVIALARSLGRAVAADGEAFEWQDAGGAVVHAAFVRGRLTTWRLQRSDVG